MFTSITDKATLLVLKLRNDIKMSPVGDLKEKGQGLVEYAIILALIAIVVIAVMHFFGWRVHHVYDQIVCAFSPDGTFVEDGFTVSCDAL